MTDKQIVAAYMADTLLNARIVPDWEVLCILSQTNLSIQRRSRLIDMIAEECDRLRAPYVDRDTCL